MSLVETYFNHTDKYKSIYGEKTLVLMQVGAFFEVYGKILSDPKTKEQKIGHSNIEEFCKICDLNMSEKVKGKILMAGFRDYVIDKYIEKLQNAGYTTVVYIQNENNPSAEREFAGVYSAGTHFHQSHEIITNNITALRILNIRATKIRPKEKIIFGMATIDVLTGNCNINETEEEFFHNPSTYDEIEKYYSIYNPNELIILYESEKMSEEKIRDIVQFIGTRSKIVRLVDLSEVDDLKNKEEVKHISYKDRFSLSSRANNCEKETYKVAILEQFYLDNDKNSIIEKENNNYIKELINRLKHKEIGLNAFVFLLDYIYSHNPNLVNKIQEPEIHNNTDKLLLANHSLKQLNFLDNGDSNLTNVNNKLKSVVSFVNNCNTLMGKRKMTTTLMNPITSVEKLNRMYNLTEYIIENYNELSFLREKMKKIRDLEKVYRKVVLKKITPYEVFDLIENIKIVMRINNDLDNIITKDKENNDFVSVNSVLERKSGETTLFKNISESITMLYNYLSSTINTEFNVSAGYKSHIDLDNKNEYVDEDIESNQNVKITELDNFNIHFFMKGMYPELDMKYKKYLETYDIIIAIKDYLSNQIKSSEKKTKEGDYCKIYETDKSGLCIKTTETRYKKLLVQLKNEENGNGNENGININKIAQIKYKSSYDGIENTVELNISKINKEMRGKDVVIVSNEINDYCDNVNIYKEEFKKCLISTYQEFLDELKTMKDYFQSIIEYIIFLDINECKAYNALSYNYCRPVIEDKNGDETSFVDVSGIRHILIEQFQTREGYVVNDIDLGIKENNQNGILLYGTNAVGKSSIIKALGICVILAQSGMFVPCARMLYYPFRSIFTRILGNDNIFKGLSTFAVEMSELRTILRESNKNSLVLGDELCSGTEMGSALAIFSSGLIDLHNKNVKFIFATHFHEMNNLEEIRELKNMKMKHMSVFYDREKDKLIYDRKLSDGAGNNMYGLEVCKSLKLPSDFLDLAFRLRAKMNEEYESVSMFKQSRYNSKKILGMCEICKTNKSVEVHHIKQQKDANEYGIVDGIHKNHLSNLMSLCEECHDKIHR